MYVSVCLLLGYDPTLTVYIGCIHSCLVVVVGVPDGLRHARWCPIRNRCRSPVVIEIEVS
jgi:hypothetical protein